MGETESSTSEEDEKSPVVSHAETESGRSSADATPSAGSVEESRRQSSGGQLTLLDGKVGRRVRKHPGAPKRCRTAFIIFSQFRHAELRKQAAGSKKVGNTKPDGDGNPEELSPPPTVSQTMNIARMVSEEWRSMSPADRQKWDDMAEQDKKRYIQEKEAYAGPWTVQKDTKRRKHPTAPKKPTPAYFCFANERRQAVKNEDTSATNAEVSKKLSRMWKEADPATRQLYVDKETREKEEYAKAIEEWKRLHKKESWWEYEEESRGGSEKKPSTQKEEKANKRKRTASTLSRKKRPLGQSSAADSTTRESTIEDELRRAKQNVQTTSSMPSSLIPSQAATLDASLETQNSLEITRRAILMARLQEQQQIENLFHQRAAQQDNMLHAGGSPAAESLALRNQLLDPYGTLRAHQLMAQSTSLGDRVSTDVLQAQQARLGLLNPGYRTDLGLLLNTPGLNAEALLQHQRDAALANRADALARIGAYNIHPGAGGNVAQRSHLLGALSAGNPQTSMEQQQTAALLANLAGSAHGPRVARFGANGSVQMQDALREALLAQSLGAFTSMPSQAQQTGSSRLELEGPQGQKPSQPK